MEKFKSDLRPGVENMADKEEEDVNGRILTTSKIHACHKVKERILHNTIM